MYAVEKASSSSVCLPAAERFATSRPPSSAALSAATSLLDRVVELRGEDFLILLIAESTDSFMSFLSPFSSLPVRPVTSKLQFCFEIKLFNYRRRKEILMYTTFIYNI